MMESADYYIGVDVGTASVRAGLVTSQGKVIKNLKKSRFLPDTSKLVQRCVAVGHVSESLLVYRYFGLLSCKTFCISCMWKVGPGCLYQKIILDPSQVVGVYQLSIALSKHFQFFSGCGPGCAGGGCGEQKTWPISTKQSGGVFSVFIWIILFWWQFVMVEKGTVINGSL